MIKDIDYYVQTRGLRPVLQSALDWHKVNESRSVDLANDLDSALPDWDVALRVVTRVCLDPGHPYRVEAAVQDFAGFLQDNERKNT